MSLVIFWDIDGTLLTTARAGVFALEEAALEVCGAKPDLDQLKTSGLTDSEVARLVVEAAGTEPEPETVSEFLRAYERYLPDRLHRRQGRVLPGVKEALEEFDRRPDVTSSLLTGNTRVGAIAKLDHYGLSGYFKDGAFCQDGDDRAAIAAKARELVRGLTGQANSEPDMVVIGDTPHDIRCGKGIAARTVGVASGEHEESALKDAGAWLTLPGIPVPEQLAAALGLEPVAAR